MCVSFDFHTEGVQAIAPSLVLLAYLFNRPPNRRTGIFVPMQRLMRGRDG